MDFIIPCMVSGTFLIGIIQGQSVNQTSAHQVILEGESLLLECSYKISGFPYVFWYRWNPDHTPIILIDGVTQKSHKGFTGTHEQEKSTFSIGKKQIEVSDAAGSNAQQINQTRAPQIVWQEASILLECSYKVSGISYSSWYVQYPGKAPTMLLHFLNQKEHKGFSANQDKIKSSYNLKKDQAELSDSGIYYCCVDDTVIEDSSSAVT